MNPYEILGVEKHATAEEIKKAFRKLSKKAHPDVGGNEDDFKTLEEAYRILSDADERAYYDQTGERKPHGPDLARAEMMTMLSEVIGASCAEIKNPAVDNLIKTCRHHIREGVRRITESAVKAGEHRIKLEAIKKRITARGEDNVMAGIVQNQIDSLDNQLARAKIMLQAFKDGDAFFDDYDYEVTKLLTNSDLQEALQRQASGQYDNFFKINIA